ncbi:MAG TPA: hypothetical protein VGO29_11230 [Solirubrobacteraceae bacterium]|jgi:hypothetical protein|nr:hypothetical protein [Solirubrobacteraceae bacterium]
MAAVPIKPAYGPTLGRLLSPRWRAASRWTRGLVWALVVAVIALAVGAFLTLENAHYSRGGRVPFSFNYRAINRVAAAPGEWVRLERRAADGRLRDSYAVRPLTLPPYAGSLTGELPLYAASYIRALRSRDADFVLRGEGKTRVNTVPAYQVVYTTRVAGRTMFGRDVLLVAQRPGEREGVNIVMLTSPTANAQVTSPLEVASAGVLLKPLKTFTLG